MNWDMQTPLVCHSNQLLVLDIAVCVCYQAAVTIAVLLPSYQQRIFVTATTNEKLSGCLYFYFD